MTTELSLPKLRADLQQALKAWREDSAAAVSLTYLRLFQRIRRKGADTDRQALNRILLTALETLEARHKVEAELLRQRFLNGMAMRALANRFNISEATAYRTQKEAVNHLALILQSRERQAREAWQAALEKRLEAPTYLRLIGFDGYLDELQRVLTTPGPPWLLSIEGLGGAGKTALADALSRRIIWQGNFDDFAWVSAKQQEFLPEMGLAPTNRPALDADALVDALIVQLDDAIPLAQSPRSKLDALKTLLKQQPAMVVVDNLETAVDHQALLPLLRALANPGKILLTSRRSLRAQPDVFCFTLKALDQAQTRRFIRYQAKVRGLTMLEKAPDSQLDDIYKIVGGNPLAIKLVLGQVSLFPLSHVLDNLAQARGKRSDELYTYIYWQAWRSLDPASRQALLVMPLVADGTLAQLATISQLERDELEGALQNLMTLSLVQMGGDLEERRYTIHRLTETFLLREALKWQL